jgi:hypothetical protein
LATSSGYNVGGSAAGTWWSAAIVAAMCLHLTALAVPISSLRSELRCERAAQCIQTQSVLGWKRRQAFSAAELTDASLGSEISPRRSGDRAVYFVELRRRNGSTIRLLPKADSPRDPDTVQTLQRARAFLRGEVSSFQHDKGFGWFEAVLLLFGLGIGALGLHFARVAVQRARRRAR